MSWIPSEAVEGSQRLAFDAGMAHYDEPLPDAIEDLEELRDADRFRFANVLQAWIEVDEKGRITDYGQGGGGLMGATTVKVGPVARTFEAIGLQPELRKIKAGDALVRQGERGSEVFLLLDGVLRVEEDGVRLAEYGPGVLLGERTALEEGRRTSTLVAVTPCRVAAVKARELDRGALQELSKDHRRTKPDPRS